MSEGERMVIESFTEESWELILKDCGAILTGMSGYRRTELLNNKQYVKETICSLAKMTPFPSKVQAEQCQSLFN